MYRHYQSSEDVFVDREEYIEWMNRALEQCRDKAIVLHLRGIGGIGKSSLQDHWKRTIQDNIPLDCQQYTEFYDRLNIVAKGAALIGVRLQRFDVLWQIRQRFVEGVEPVRQEGREWAKEVAMAIPFIGSLASIGSAISAVGSKIAPKLKEKYSTVGKWLEDRLGKGHIERLLEILWKAPRDAEFLFLDALLEDLNCRNNLDKPILFLFDHFEYIDSDTALWRYSGKKISEAELWCVFLSSLSNSVAVLGSRMSSPVKGDVKRSIEERELTELDEISTRELLEKREVTDKAMQGKIIAVSGGNPFIIDAICDMKDTGEIALDDVESLRADTLDEVRLKTWRRLFNMSKDLQDIINRAGLLEFFNRNTMNIIAPSMTSDQWDQLLHLSFIRTRDDGTWILHDLARELIIVELGVRGKNLAEEIAQLLEKESERTGDMTLIGHAFSVKAIFSEAEVIRETKETIRDLVRKDAALEALQILENTVFQSAKGKAELRGLKGKVLTLAARFSEAEEALREAIRINEELAKDEPEKHLDSVAEYLCDLSELFRGFREDEAFDLISRALEIQRAVAAEGDCKQLKSLARILVQYGSLHGKKKPSDAIGPIKEGIAIYKKIGSLAEVPYSLNILGLMLFDSHKWTEAEQAHLEAIDLQKGIIESEPDNLRLKSVLAAMLHNMAFLTDFTGNTEKAERFFTEALHIRRNLADRAPEVYLQRLMPELWSHSVFYLRINKLDEAEKLSLEVLEIARNKVEESPEQFEPWIARAQIVLSEIYSIRGKTSLAVSSMRKAIDISRKLVGLGATALLLATRLESYALIQIRNGEYESPEEALLEGIRIFRDNEPLPPRMHASFASLLCNHGILVWRKGRLPEAKAVLEESLEMSRGSAEEVPEVYKGLLSVVLCNLASVLADNDEIEGAGFHFQESLSITEHLAERTPRIYRIHLAVALHNYSKFLLISNRELEAHSILMRAIEIKRELVKETPRIFEPSLMTSLRNLVVMLRKDKSSIRENILQEITAINKQSPYPSPKELNKEEDWSMEWEEKYAGFGETT